MTDASLPLILERDIPPAAVPLVRHFLDTYASETNKVVTIWSQFLTGDLSYAPHPRATSVEDIMKHQLLSERRFFAEFLGAPEPPAGEILPGSSVELYARRAVDLARPRLIFLAARVESWWLEVVPFFDVHRQRAWIFWRRVLHTAHHRTQLAVYLRLLDRKVPSTYGPSADMTWAGADPTVNVAAAGRRSKPE